MRFTGGLHEDAAKAGTRWTTQVFNRCIARSEEERESAVVIEA